MTTTYAPAPTRQTRAASPTVPRAAGPAAARP